MATTSFYVLFESASGFGLFSVLENEDIGNVYLEVILFYLLANCAYLLHLTGAPVTTCSYIH